MLLNKKQQTGFRESRLTYLANLAGKSILAITLKVIP